MQRNHFTPIKPIIGLLPAPSDDAGTHFKAQTGKASMCTMPSPKAKVRCRIPLQHVHYIWIRL